MKKLLVVLGLLLSACASARAGVTAIPLESCRTLLIGGQFNGFATRHDQTGSARAFTYWAFQSSFDPVMACEFYIMPDMAPNFDPAIQILFKAESTVSGNVAFGTMAAAYVVGSVGDNTPILYPSKGGDVQLIATAPAFVMNAVTLTHAPIYDADSGASCASEGNLCIYRKVSLILMRMSDSLNCVDANWPWTCCSGNAVGTCFSGSNALTPQDVEAIVLTY